MFLIWHYFANFLDILHQRILQNSTQMKNLFSVETWNEKEANALFQQRSQIVVLDFVAIIFRVINRLLVNKGKHFENYAADLSNAIFKKVCFVNWQFRMTFLLLNEMQS